MGGEPLLLNQPSVDDFPQIEEVTAQGYGIVAGNKNYRNRESGTLGTIATSKKDQSSVAMKAEFTAKNIDNE